MPQTIQCPYPAWTYGPEGRLVGAPHRNGVAGFNKADYPLHAAPLEHWEGFLFTNLAKDPAPFAAAFGPLQGRFARVNLPALVTARRIEYDVRANWKLVAQNYSERRPRPTTHPELR